MSVVIETIISELSVVIWMYRLCVITGPSPVSCLSLLGINIVDLASFVLFLLAPNNISHLDDSFTLQHFSK